MDYKKNLDLIRNSTLDSVQQKVAVVEQFMTNFEAYEQAMAKLLAPSTGGPLNLERLDQIGSLLGDQDVYCLIAGGLNSDDDWFVMGIWRPNPGADPVVSTERVVMNVVLLHQLKQAVFLNSSADDWDELLATQARQLFGRMFPGELGMRIRQARRVILAPNQQAWSVPYAALVINETGAPQFLGIEKALSFTESLSLLRHLNRPWSKPGGRALVVSGLCYDSNDLKTTLKHFGVDYLSSLSKNAITGKEIATLYQAVHLSGQDAREDEIRNLLPKAPMIHLATHGFNVVGDARPDIYDALARIRSGLPGLWFMPSTGSFATTSSGDGLLQAWEIRYQLQIDADLVTLAACEAGGAKSILANGPELPLAFLYAGARSVVAPLTKVDDNATSYLMAEFYREIRIGSPKDEALQRSMRRTQERPEFRHPYYWATFELFGATTNCLAKQPIR